MHFKVNNVNQAFKELVSLFSTPNPAIERKSSRVGEVLMINEPVIVTYRSPLCRVLFNIERDCNHFFHLYEALHMLAGRRDIVPLNYYSSNYGKQVQDGDDPNANGAYGYRWRHAYAGQHDSVRGWRIGTECDQLAIIIDQLKRKPESRRVVLQMWNVEDDLLKIDTSKDVCCNTAAYFSLRVCPYDNDGDGNCHKHQPACPKYLDMTVTNRSNDLIWGMLGANAVHFAFLQEYLAAGIGVGVGVYHQFTNNLHVYTERFEPEKWLSDYAPGGRNSDKWYGFANYQTVPLVKDLATFDKECADFVQMHSRYVGEGEECNWQEPFLAQVAHPMMMAFHCYKQKMYPASMDWAQQIRADDWRTAAVGWLTRRQEKRANAAT